MTKPSTNGMDTLVQLHVLEAPDHTVLPNVGRYDLRKLSFEWTELEVATVIMELSTHDDYVVLRFEGVESLHVDCGDIPSAVRIRIQDTSGCPSATHRIPPVRVGGVEHSGLSFWARKVERISDNE